MDLQTLWFIIITVLFSVFFLLEGFDYGVGILMGILGKSEEERKLISKSIGPFWDGNEVWMLTAGGALFAAFPEWYATMFSGYYLALVLMLAALIIRVIGIELRGKTDDAKERKRFDLMFTVGSAVAALLWGVVAVNFILGLPIDENKEYAGNFFNLLDIRAILGGVTSLLLCWLHGAIFLAGQSSGALREKASHQAQKVWLPAMLAVVITTVAVIASSANTSVMGIVIGGAGIIGLGVGKLFISKQQFVKAFICSGFAIVAGTVGIFTSIFPNVFISSIRPENNLTIYNASSSNYTLTIMSIVAGILVPIVIGYQVWTYKTFLNKGQ
jgi:cytochrome bd ubiquinol oxidase subunit II